MRILVTGATGYVGGRLLPVLLERGHDVHALARRPEKAELPAGVEVHKGDVVSGEGLAEALAGIDVAYYLVHSMGRGNSGDFAEQDRRAARTFGTAARDAGVRRVVYLGGLEGEDADSEHLRSRHEVAEILRELVSELVYVRAAMVLGSGSESFLIMSTLVHRLPLMVTPRWVDTRSQPVAIRDVVAALAAAGEREEAVAEVQLGGADVLTYREMMGRYAELAGRRRPLMLSVPLLTPRLSSLWVALVTPADRGVALPLVHGLSTEMVVRTPAAAGDQRRPAGLRRGGPRGAAAPNLRPRMLRGLLNRDKKVAQTVIVDPDDHTTMDAHGAVRSVQAADLIMTAEQLEELWSPRQLENLARTYWRFLSRATLGLIRVQYTEGERFVCLLFRPFVLLRFQAPEYEMDATRGIVRWRIERGVLVSRAGRGGNGKLEIDVQRCPADEPGKARLHVEVEVANFYPAIASRLGRWLYENTQSRIHVIVTHGFLRSLARLKLAESRVGRYARIEDVPDPEGATPAERADRDEAEVAQL